jgi:tetratricopeptide (TPR) repeat protein
MKSQQASSQRQRQDDEFLQWLSPSYWQVEALLHTLRDKRSEETLQWAREMSEFRDWRLSEPKQSAKNRILWLRGPLGIGKSTMSAYLIDLLKVMYPKSIVAYFFCRSNQAGLTKAHEIIRTLAYQCIEDNRAARSILEVLKNKDFRISEDLGIGYLFEKILLEPLRSSEKDIYIVIDGLDEADYTSSHSSNYSSEPDLNVLLGSLAKLPSTRLLLVSRPSANILNIIPGTITTKTIGKSENANDISAYVKTALQGSERLQKHFKSVNINAYQYFQGKANGVFLWVELVIKQLEKANSKAVFQKYLDGFPDAAGGIERLYETILLRFSEDDQPWVIEVTRWLVVAERQMTVPELEDAVEWCLQDQHVDFKQFLEVDCGSILQLMLRKDDEIFVQLVHETFRSFLLNQRVCPEKFSVNEAEAHGHLTSKCLSRISKVGDNNIYCSSQWCLHLPKASSARQAQELLTCLHDFFASDSLEKWIKEVLARRGVDFEDRCLNDIIKWLERCEVHNPDFLPGRSCMARSLRWREDVLSKKSCLGESIGKAAARIWLREGLDSIISWRGSFSIALRHYWNRETRDKGMTNLGDFEELLQTRFGSIAEWSGVREALPVNQLSRAVAYFGLGRWEDCIQCLGHCNGIQDTDMGFRYFGRSLLAERDYDRAVEVFKEVKRPIFSDIDCLRTAYLRRSDIDGAIEATANVIDARLEPLHPSTSERILREKLYALYKRKRDFEGAIKAFSSARAEDLLYTAKAHLEINDDFDKAIVLTESMLISVKDVIPGWGNQLLAAYKKKGHCDGVIQCLWRAVEKAPHDQSLWDCLIQAHEESGDYENAIKVLELVTDKFPTGSSSYFTKDMFTARTDPRIRHYEGYIGWTRELELAATRHPGECIFWERLGNACRATKDYSRAVTAFENAFNAAGTCWPSLGQSLFQAHKDNGDYDAAIRLVETLLERSGFGGASHCFHGLYWNRSLIEVYQAKGDSDGAIQLFDNIVKKTRGHKADWAMVGLLDAHKAKLDYDGALRKYEKAIAESIIVPSVTLEYEVLDLYLSKRDYEGAAKRFNDIAQRVPLKSWPWIALGQVHHAQGDYDKAIEVHSSAARLITVDYYFPRQIGDAYLAKSQFEIAIDAYQRSAQISGSKTYLWASLQIRRGNLCYLYPPRAVPIDDNLSKSFLWYSLGIAYEGRYMNDEANNIYNAAVCKYLAALKVDYNDLLWVHKGDVELLDLEICGRFQLSEAVVWSALGTAYKARRDFQDAVAAFRKAFELESNNAWLKRVICELETTLATAETTGSGQIDETEDIATANCLEDRV